MKNTEINIKKIDLRCENICDTQLPDNSFDLVYSIGVLGEHSPFDLFICNKVHKLLKPNGVFFFTIVDINSKKSFKRKIAMYVYPVLPKYIKKIIDKRLKKIFYMKKELLESVMVNSAFREHTIDRHVSTSPKWKGAHYECTARKTT